MSHLSLKSLNDPSRSRYLAILQSKSKLLTSPNSSKKYEDKYFLPRL
jgi:hypothetical protein